MKIQRILANGALTLLLIAGVISMAGCKKQPKCGCDGDALDTLQTRLMSISHIMLKPNQPSSVPLWSNYDIYYFCNPSAFMEKLKTFEQGAEILVSGEYFYECNYLMNAGNGGSYSMYRIYQIQVTDVAAYDYGK